MKVGDMIRNLSCFLLVSLALGEQHLHGQGFLKARSSTPADDTLVQQSMGKVKGLMNFVRQKSGMAVAQPPVSDEQRAQVDWKEFAIMNSGEMFMSFLLWLGLYAICAWYYHSSVLYFAPPEKKDKEAKHLSDNYRAFQEFKTGLLDCGKAAKFPGICFWSCFCPGIRWSDTMGKLGIHSFWKAFWFLTILMSIAFIPMATIPCVVIQVSYMTYHRQEFRKKFDFEEQGGMTWATDCLTYWCCMTCAVAQEARHTRQAMLAAHPAIELPEEMRVTPRSA